MLSHVVMYAGSAENNIMHHKLFEKSVKESGLKKFGSLSNSAPSTAKAKFPKPQSGISSGV